MRSGVVQEDGRWVLQDSVQEMLCIPSATVALNLVQLIVRQAPNLYVMCKLPVVACTRC